MNTLGVVLRAAGAAATVWVGYSIYDAYRGGFFDLPDMPPGAFALSYKNGLRAIMVGIKDERPQRKYLAMPHEVPPWFHDTWSFCERPAEEEARSVPDIGPGTRLEAICKIRADNDIIVRGAIFSRPNI